MPWLILFMAGLFEVGWAIGLKYTHGFTRLWPSVFTVLAMAVSLFLLAQALRTLPIGTAYAVWTGVGAVGTAVLGIVLFSEPATAMRLGCIALIVTGIVGLKFASAEGRPDLSGARRGRPAGHKAQAPATNSVAASPAPTTRLRPRDLAR